MKIKYDHEADTKYITFSKGRRRDVAFTTKKIKSWLLADYSKEGVLLGIEVLNASTNDGDLMVSNGDIQYIPRRSRSAHRSPEVNLQPVISRWFANAGAS